VLVTFMNSMLALVLAEITSSFPTSGGVYFFAHRLAGAVWCGVVWPQPQRRPLSTARH
jgi:amino acid transporter